MFHEVAEERGCLTRGILIECDKKKKREISGLIGPDTENCKRI